MKKLKMNANMRKSVRIGPDAEVKDGGQESYIASCIKNWFRYIVEENIMMNFP